MKILKKLLVTVLCVSFLALSLPAFAAEAATDTPTTSTGVTATTDAQICQSLGLVKGKGDGVSDIYLDSRPNRLQAAIVFLRLNGMEGSASNFKRPDNFADANAVSDPAGKNILSYLVAHPGLGFQGYGSNFGPNDTITAQQFYKVLLTALGYKQGQDFEWNDTLTFAADKGLTRVASVKNLTVKDLCTATVEALSAKVKGSKETLLAQVVDRGGIKRESAQELGLIPQNTVRGDRDQEAAGDQGAPMPMIAFVSCNNNKLIFSISCVDSLAGFHYTYSVGATPSMPNADSAFLRSAGSIEVPLVGTPNEDTQITVMAYSSVPGKADSPICSLTIMGSQFLQG